MVSYLRKTVWEAAAEAHRRRTDVSGRQQSGGGRSHGRLFFLCVCKVESRHQRRGGTDLCPANEDGAVRTLAPRFGASGWHMQAHRLPYHPNTSQLPPQTVSFERLTLTPCASGCSAPSRRSMPLARTATPRRSAGSDPTPAGRHSHPTAVEDSLPGISGASPSSPARDVPLSGQDGVWSSISGPFSSQCLLARAHRRLTSAVEK